MATKIVCPKCFDELPDAQEWKNHMSEVHGGFTDDEKAAAGIVDPLEDAREVLSEPGEPEVIPPRGGKRRAGAGKRDAAMRGIGKILLSEASALPYAAWAGMTGNPRYALTVEEQQELTNAYMELMESLDIDFSNPKWAFIAVLAINGRFVATRLGIEIPEMDSAE